MRFRSTRQRRRGVVMVETAIIMTTVLLFLFGLIDMSRLVFRNHMLSQAAREGARRAAVHGSLAPSSWNGGPWGPTTYGPKAANSGDPQTKAVLPFLFEVDPSTVTVKYEWIDGSNAAESRVRVTLSTTWSPWLLSMFSTNAFTLSASSTMPIAH